MADSNGKSVIITGSGRGIGRAIALRLGRDGFSILVNDLDAGPAAEVVAEIEAAGGVAIANGADVTDEDQGAAMVEQAAGAFGQLDVMIANAGLGVQKRITETTWDDFDRILKVNLYGVFLCGREAARHMVPRKAGKIIDVVAEQYYGSLAGVSAEQALKVVLAYEPLWAINTGVTATPEQAEEVHGELRQLMKARYNDQVANEVRILYGGSVKPGNAGDLLPQPNIDGALVGGASLTAEAFLGIIEHAKSS